MIALQNFQQLIGRKVRRLFVIVWPPIREATISDVDMSIGFEFDGKEGIVYQIQIDKNDGWTPLVTETEANEIYEWDKFQTRVDSWMHGLIDVPIQNEFFEATHEELFRNISSQEILNIEFASLKGELNPFAVKVVFRDDFVILSSTSDGNTIETSMFNQLDNLEVFKGLGDFDFISLKSLINQNGPAD